MQNRMTKWPVLLVHGLFYREDYWGRVPGVLRREGAVVLCPRHQSTARVAQSGGQLARLIREAAGEGGKVNLIAHSKGGAGQPLGHQPGGGGSLRGLPHHRQHPPPGLSLCG